MLNHQQLLDEISLEELSNFGAHSTCIAARSPSAETRVSIADCRPTMDDFSSDAFERCHVMPPSRWPFAIDIEDAQCEIDRANRLKSNFLAAANRELRQPVQALALLLPSIERQVATNPQAVETVEMMRQALSGLNNLLGAMLEISYLDADLIKPSMKVIDVGALLRRLSGEYSEKASLHGLKLRVFAPETFAFSDSYLLESTLRCLLENAIRFTACGGILVGLRRRGKGVRIDVVDTGIGIPTERQPEIFEEFIRVENHGRHGEKGLGLGLAIAARQAKLLGSKIEIHSRAGRGSRFSLWMPGTPAGDCFNHAENAGGESRTRVLIVEDDSILRFSLECLVQQWGYSTCTAADANEALEYFANDPTCFDAIITDYHMGSGMTGVEMLNELEQRIGHRLPALILTAETRPESLTAIVASGVEVAHKPILPEELEGRFSALLLS